MTTADVLLLLGIAALVAAFGDEVARQSSRRLGMLAAGPILLIVASPLVPNRSIVLGFSLDDVLPLLGLCLMLPLVPWRRIRDVRWGPAPAPVIMFVGIALMVLAGVISAVLVGGSASDIVRLSIRGSGRLLFLLAVVVCVAVLCSTARARLATAWMVAAVGTFEAVFGLVAYLIGLPGGAGLEPIRKSSILFGEVPGRIAGTIGISANFAAAILMMSTLVTAGLALGPVPRRTRLVLLVAVGLQLAAIALTYTRVSLGLVVVGLVVLLLLRSKPLLIAPIALLILPIAILTPTVERIVNDVPDRLALWTSAFLLMLDHPVAGVGPGEMLAAVARDPERYRFTAFGAAWSTAHNTVLLAGAETGVLGAIGAIVLDLGLVVLVARTILSSRGPAGSLAIGSALAVAAFVLQGMVNNLLTVGVTGLFAAVVLGSQLLEARLDPERVDNEAHTRAGSRPGSASSPVGRAGSRVVGARQRIPAIPSSQIRAASGQPRRNPEIRPTGAGRAQGQPVPPG